MPGDTVPASDVRVVLHRIGPAVQGPVDSVRTDTAGRFGFRIVPDTAALYLLSASYRDIEYFSPPLRLDAATPPDSAVVIVVADTSTTAPVRLAARHLVVGRPGGEGSRDALDLLVLENSGIYTRIAADSAGASWTMPLPRGALEMSIGEGDFSPDAVVQRGDTLVLGAPVAPGEKQLMVQYHLPATTDRIAVPFGDSVEMVNILVEEEGARVTGGTLVAADSQLIEGRVFRRWSGSVPAGGTVVLAFAGAASTPSWLLPAMVALAAAALLAAAWRLRRLQVPAGAGPVAADGGAERLLDAVAALDARYLGREAEVPADEWARYQDERARLKRALETALAGAPPPP